MYNMKVLDTAVAVDVENHIENANVVNNSFVLYMVLSLCWRKNERYFKQ